jgi:hypothetical protein
MRRYQAALANRRQRAEHRAMRAQVRDVKDRITAAGRARARSSARPRSCAGRRRRVPVSQVRRSARSAAGADDGGCDPAGSSRKGGAL